ncbi:DNA topoisomerase 1-like [Centruroides sculpturatus]|uniref:DNA topoisomerase 1-like n=1 Tax=Centruroides sculpturatus TaxID=218467 RepID=UPI000C6E3699|nr:DNA topoisomerase 1-like [Centruroides sculpturatus]
MTKTRKEKSNKNKKWKRLQHNGPCLEPSYSRLPNSIHFLYNGQTLKLSKSAEEAASYYAKLFNHRYSRKKRFVKNFFNDWRQIMTSREREVVTNFELCDFRNISEFYRNQWDEKKRLSREEKIRQRNELLEKYGYCIIDGKRQKIGNFKVEPGGLFIGRGNHPKMGRIKKRVRAEDVTINIGELDNVPNPPAGHQWKEVKHDDTAIWLSSWTESLFNKTKYIFPDSCSKFKMRSDLEKYETARKLNGCIENIRETYKNMWQSGYIRERQEAVALYFIDRLALRAGNEKKEDTLDTVGCCSLKAKHVKLRREGNNYKVFLDFRGKDNIRYMNNISVEREVYQNLIDFISNKRPGDKLFDQLNATLLNGLLNQMMEGLTAKVFRTYNASKCFQNELNILTTGNTNLEQKMLAYNRAARKVAALCNHRRSVPKNYTKQMKNLQDKIQKKRKLVEICEKEAILAKKEFERCGTDKARMTYFRKQNSLHKTKEQLQKLELSAINKTESKSIAISTSKLNYLDPRISVAWCKKWDVPIEKVFNKTERSRFEWAIQTADANFVF